MSSSIHHDSKEIIMITDVLLSLGEKHYSHEPAVKFVELSYTCSK